ncbi:hypothetical protein CIHG_08129 [Coccidioides immitis H538.4]|uniref:RRM domain-containing protein n=1 Tax=Coccidioides immitis H538.4 TaxID=396776 RepID=A0A0J8RYS4_COCIT|nr:hypothetical protein CIHG_08129 [Coccidioides immitis H538.4]
MLKPFRIRDLLDPDFDDQVHAASLGVKDSEGHDRTDLHAGCADNTVQEGHRQSVLSPHPIYDGVVEVSRSEYDETISKFPEAQLHYIDDDDGGRVTVGSSFELAQRLDEPPAGISALQAMSPLGQLGGSPMHIFDINKSSSSIKTWKTFHARTSSRARASQSHMSPLLDVSETHEAHAVPPSNFNNISDDPLKRWFEACNPPKLPPEDVQKAEAASENKSPQDQAEAACGSTSSCGSLTDEGRKQAQAAGAKFRKSRNIWSKSSSPLLAPTAAQNFWSCYQASQPKSDGKELSEREPKNAESPIGEQPPSLLAAFEAELSKLVEQNTQSEANVEANTVKSNTEPAMSSTQETRQPASGPKPEEQPVPKAAELVGQTLQALLGTIGHLASELRSRLPEVEQRLSSAQQQVPAQIEATVQEALNAMRIHVQNLAKAVQDAAVSTREAAARSRHAEMLAAAQAEGLRGLASELGEMGKTLFSAFETGFSVNNGANTRETHNPSSATEVPNDSTQSQAHKDGSPQPDSNDNVASITQNTLSNIEAYFDAAETQSTSRNTLFIGGLKSTTTEAAVLTTLMKHGFVGRVKLPTDATTGRHAGFGYIHFPSSYAAAGALQALENSVIDDQGINLEYSQGAPADRPSDSPSARVSPLEESSSGNAGASDVLLPPTRDNIPHRQSRAADPIGGHASQRSYPNVTFDASNNENSHSAKVRRANSLGALSSKQRNRDSTQDGNSRPDRVRTGDHILRRRTVYDRTTNRRREHTRSGPADPRPPILADSEDITSDFSTRYPPLSTLLGHPASSRGNPGGHESSRDSGQRDSADSIKISNLLQPAGASSQQPPTQGSSAMSAHERGPLPPPVLDKLPGSWPREQNRNISGAARQGFPAPHRPDVNEPQNLTRPRLSSPFTPLFGQRPSSRHPHPHPLIANDRYHPYATHGRPHSSHAPPLEQSYNTPGSFPPEPQASTYLPNNHNPFSDAWSPVLHEDINACVNNLVSLGYSGENRSTARLRVYAEAARGNINEAIELIEEERKAYERRSTHT